MDFQLGIFWIAITLIITVNALPAHYAPLKSERTSLAVSDEDIFRNRGPENGRNERNRPTVDTTESTAFRPSKNASRASEETPRSEISYTESVNDDQPRDFTTKSTNSDRGGTRRAVVARTEADYRSTTTEKSDKSDSSLSQSIQENVAAIKKPVLQTITSVGSAQCDKVKKLLGVSYSQIENEKEPDLNSLQLHVRSYSATRVYNISDAYAVIPRTLDYGKKTVIFVHGFTDDPTKASFQNISESFLQHVDCNIIALDGSSLIKWLYLRSTSYVRFMGEKLGRVLAELVNTGVNPNAIHIIGHSLGSHIAGFTGKNFQRLLGQKIGRISGLDPAGPCFTDVDENLRLHKDDANFVDVMHTDAGVYGITDSIGHVDFFVNGGSDQPNCFFESCSHSRSWLYYSESIEDERAFLAKKCKDWKTFERNECGRTEIATMGYYTPTNVRGDFYLQTSGVAPYGRGAAGLEHDGDLPAAKKVLDAGSDVVDGIVNVAGKVFG